MDREFRVVAQGELGNLARHGSSHGHGSFEFFSLELAQEAIVLVPLLCLGQRWRG